MDKKYDEALERAKEQIKVCGDNEGRKRMIYAIFPELVDNKDEEIRKDIIEYLKLVGKGDGDYAQPMINRWIAYLEKQKEHQPNIELIQRSWYMEGYHDREFGKEPRWIIKTGEGGPRHELNPKWGEPLQKEQSITANGLDEEIHRFFDDCIDVHEAKLYGNISERVIPVDCYELTARHFAKWGEKQKEQKHPTLDDPDIYGDWDKDLLGEIHSWLGHLDGKYTPYSIDDIKLTARHFVEWQKQKEQKPIEHLELKAGHWYICHRAYCCRADHLTVKEGERFQCEKDGIVKGFVVKEPEKYFIEVSAPAPMEDEQKEQKPKPYFYCKYGGTIPLCSDCKRNHYNSSFKTEEITTWYAPSNGTKHCIDYIQKEQKPVDYDHEMWKNCEANFEGGKKEVIEHPERYGLQKPLEWSEEFEDNIRNLLHDKLTGYSEDGSMSWTTLIDDKTLKDIVSGIWFYVGKEALKYPNKELNVSKWSEEDNAAHTRILGAVAKAFMGVLPTKPSEEDVNWLKTLPERFNLQPKQEWSKEDDALLKEIVSFFKDGTVKLQHDLDLYAGFLENKFKSLRPQPRQEANIDKLRKISTKAEEDWLEIQKQWEKEDKYKSWMADYFRQETIDGYDWKASIIESKKEGKLSFLWNSMLMGRLGMYVRNWMREQHPEIDQDFPNYADFEDYSWKIFQDLVNEWEVIPTERNVEDVAAEYIEGVKSVHEEPDWNLMHTAVIYGYQLGTEKWKTK